MGKEEKLLLNDWMKECLFLWSLLISRSKCTEVGTWQVPQLQQQVTFIKCLLASC